MDDFRDAPEDRSSNPSELHAAVDLLRSLSEVEQALPIRAIRSEAKLLALIKAEPGLPVKHYLSKLGLSQRGFFNALAVLTNAGLISEYPSELDRRQKLLR